VLLSVFLVKLHLVEFGRVLIIILIIKDSYETNPFMLAQCSSLSWWTFPISLESRKQDETAILIISTHSTCKQQHYRWTVAHGYLLMLCLHLEGACWVPPPVSPLMPLIALPSSTEKNGQDPLRRGHANLLCIDPILVYVLP